MIGSESDPLKVELTTRIAAGEVVIVIGTGVSIESTANEMLASWTGLVSNGIDRCVTRGLHDVEGRDLRRWGDQQKKLLRNGDFHDLLVIAEQVSRRLGWQSRQAACHTNWNDWLTDTVGHLHPERPELIKAIHALGAPIITLNYDSLLEEVTGFQPLTWQQVNDQPLDYRQFKGSKKVLHLHGHWETGSSVVFGVRSYDAVSNAKRLQNLIRVLATIDSFIFIGCLRTLKDPNFTILLNWMREFQRPSRHRHYLLHRHGELRAISRELLENACIQPVLYGKQHAELLPFIRDLGNSGSTKPMPQFTALNLKIAEVRVEILQTLKQAGARSHNVNHLMRKIKASPLNKVGEFDDEFICVIEAEEGTIYGNRTHSEKYFSLIKEHLNLMADVKTLVRQSSK